MSTIPQLMIRRYRPSDRAAVWELHNAALHAAGAHAGNGPWDDDLHAIERVYIAQSGEFLVGEWQGELVAMGALRRMSADCAELKRMRVDPRWQRRGFGERMLLALEARARELGYHTLRLDTTTQQHAAQQLYRKHGWKEVGREEWRGWQLIYFEKALAAGSSDGGERYA